MNIVMVNYAHPRTPHVSALRAWSFSRELARKGHRVLQISRDLDTYEQAPPPHHLKTSLAQHDWSQPYLLPCQPAQQRTLEFIREGKMPLLRKPLVLWQYLARQGMFSDWTQTTRPYWAKIIKYFRPDVTWGTFGCLDAWFLARRIAQQARIPWVQDCKDTWYGYIPRPLQRFLSLRYRDAAAITANSKAMVEQVRPWFPRKAQLIYSGVDEHWLQPAEQEKSFRLMLVGSLYGDSAKDLVKGIKQWFQGLQPKDKQRVIFCYAGGQKDQVCQMAKPLEEIGCKLEIHSYLPLQQLSSLCQKASVNMYVFFDVNFHHKLIELLCCHKPILTFPGESEESISLAKSVDGSLNPCKSADEVARTLKLLWSGQRKPASQEEQLRGFTWPRQTEKLIHIFQKTLQHSH